jgi:hypothetical protein
MVNINGVDAFTLFDTGSTVNAISPALADNSNADLFELAKPVRLGLGCKGSKSKINVGAKVRTKLGPINTMWYFDVANIDFYDAIVGMPFCAKHGVVIDPANRMVIVNGNKIAAMKEGSRTGGGDKYGRKTKRTANQVTETVQSFRSFRA